jgi:hypothetical protein
MTEDELTAVKDMHPTALSIWYDRMFDMPIVQLIEKLLSYMSAGDLMDCIYDIETDQKKEVEYDNGPISPTE